jgi:hypothetical protein
MNRKPLLKIPDLVIILLAAALTGFSSYVAYIQPQNSIRVVIRGASDLEWIFPLDAEETVTVRGPLGNTVVRIHGNEAWVESSPCANQTCVGMGHADSRGDWVACLPNSVFFLIEGSNESGYYPDSTSW